MGTSTAATWCPISDGRSTDSEVYLAWFAVAGRALVSDEFRRWPAGGAAEIEDHADAGRLRPRRPGPGQASSQQQGSSRRRADWLPAASCICFHAPSDEIQHLLEAPLCRLRPLTSFLCISLDELSGRPSRHPWRRVVGLSLGVQFPPLLQAPAAAEMAAWVLDSRWVPSVLARPASSISIVRGDRLCSPAGRAAGPVQCAQYPPALYYAHSGCCVHCSV